LAREPISGRNHCDLRSGTDEAPDGCSTPQSKCGDLQMRYLIAWLLGVPLSVLVIIWLIWG
jgi:hypothetical protein